MRRNNTAGGSKATTNTNATTASVTTQENNSFMSNVMLLSPLNDDGSNSLTSTPSVAMETDQSVYDLQKDAQQRPAGEYRISNAMAYISTNYRELIELDPLKIPPSSERYCQHNNNRE